MVHVAPPKDNAEPSLPRSPTASSSSVQMLSAAKLVAELQRLLHSHETDQAVSRCRCRTLTLTLT